MSKTYAIDYNALRRVAREEARTSSTSLDGLDEIRTPSPVSRASTASSESIATPREDADSKSLHRMLENIFTVEQGIHPELKAFHERLSQSEEQPMSMEEKMSHYVALLESIKVDKPDIEIPDSYKKIPIPEEAIDFLKKQAPLKNPGSPRHPMHAQPNRD